MSVRRCQARRSIPEGLASGMYTIDPYQTGQLEDTVDVYCEMDIDGGGWTIVWASTEECSAGRPWDDVPTESISDCGMFFDDPRDGLTRLPWDILQELPQNEHIIIRTEPLEFWLQESWLKVSHSFFNEAEMNLDTERAYMSETKIYTTTTQEETGIDARIGFAIENLSEPEDRDKSGF